MNKEIELLRSDSPIPQGVSHCFSITHTCDEFIKGGGRRFDTCRMFRVNLDRDDKQHVMRCEQCLEKFG